MCIHHGIPSMIKERFTIAVVTHKSRDGLSIRLLNYHQRQILVLKGYAFPHGQIQTWNAVCVST